jgi:ABC-type transport system involved in cytochrome bd biosynthesis fused ATPase/permease subunit
MQAKQLPQAGTSRYRWQQLVHSMPPAALRVPRQPVRGDLAHTTLTSRSYKPLTVVNAAATAVKTKPAAQQHEIPRGTTAGTVLEVEGVTVSVGEVDLMVDVDWKMMPGQRVGLVGANGCGKSTLLKIMCGQRPVDAGAQQLSAPPGKTHLLLPCSAAWHLPQDE